MVLYLSLSQLCHSRRESSLNDASVIVAADAVVNLPGNELGMIAEGLGHVLDDAFGVIPIDVAVQADGAARAFVFDQTALVERENFRMLFRQPDRRRGGGRAQHDLDVVFAHHVHHAPQPGEIEFAVGGSQRPQENSPMRTTLKPAAAINSASVSHCASGFSAVPA